MNEKDREALSKLAQTQQAQQLIRMLRQEGDVQDAARQAAAGKPEKLLERMRKLMSTPEGAELVEQIGRQAQKSGLTK